LKHIHEYSKRRYVVFLDVIRAKVSMVVKRVPPEEGWLPVNVDGASKVDTSSIRCGGIIKDRRGNDQVDLQNT
jgi:hypothetical protein